MILKKLVIQCDRCGVRVGIESECTPYQQGWTDWHRYNKVANEFKQLCCYCTVTMDEAISCPGEVTNDIPKR